MRGNDGVCFMYIYRYICVCIGNVSDCDLVFGDEFLDMFVFFGDGRKSFFFICEVFFYLANKLSSFMPLNSLSVL